MVLTLTQIKDGGFNVGTLLRDIVEQNGLSTINSAKYKTIADFIFEFYADAEYNLIGDFDNISDGIKFARIWLQSRAGMVIKYIKIFEKDAVVNVDKEKNQTIVDDTIYKSKVTETFDRQIANEISPISEDAYAPISSPSSKSGTNDTREKEIEDTQNTETITNIEREHDPLRDLRIIREIDETLYTVIDRWIKTIIAEFGSVI